MLRHPIALQVFSALQAQDPSCIAPEHLHMALLAWLQLKDLIAATTALSRHHALAVKWTAPQQQAVFQTTLNCFKDAQNDAALPLLQSMCMAGLKARLPLAPMQAHELVMAMLSSGQTQSAFQVSIDRVGTELHIDSDQSGCTSVTSLQFENVQPGAITFIMGLQ